MFREMRRKKQLLSKDETIEILQRGSSGVLAVSGDDNYPYAVPLSYVYADDKIYFHTAKAGHKIDSMISNNKVSFCVIDKDQIVPDEFTTYYRSAIAFGHARFLDGEEKKEATYLLTKKYAPQSPDEKIYDAIQRNWPTLSVVEISIDYVTGKQASELIPQKK